MPLDSQSTTVWVQPSGGPLGADVHGIDLAREIDAETRAALVDAWSRHLVLRFSGQRLDDAALMRFSRLWGELDRVPIGTGAEKVNGIAAEARDWVTVISNVKVGGKPIGGLGAYESVWHVDMSYNPLPPRASLLYAIECPAEGGDTGFSNMELAYDTLSDELKAAIVGKTCTHDASRNSAGEFRRGFQEETDPRRTPGAHHPLVRRHPVTGRTSLFLGRRVGAYIHGLPVEESEALLNALWAHATQPHLAWYQRWRVGDLVMWDNRCTMHRRDAFDETARRLMHRTQIVGEPVIAA
ncbi:TauD/TfdA dioxygenase family protein [Reyranella sp.]|uniref:TauD/TfdA dioxygenase family protein n=1 Tax=Reyranella sp. TaxID=1929291 RepID=UPI003BAA4E2B